jgi:hypothetical protein
MIDAAKLLAYLKSVGLHTEELWHAVNAFEEADVYVPEPVIPSGKHRGATPKWLLDHDPKYFKWYIENGDISPKMKAKLIEMLE